MRKELTVTFLTFFAGFIALLLTLADIPYSGAIAIAVFLTLGTFTLIRQYVRLKRESIIKEKMEDMNRSLREESEHDDLTGLFDRSALRKNYNSYYGQPLGTAMIDVDHFKEFNDTYGHQVGDSILKKFGHILEDNFGDVGDCYRYGGDEFLVMVPKAEIKDFEDRLKACHAALKEPDPYMPALHPTMSAGYVISCPLTADALRKVLKMTDDQLYKAKSQGRNRSCGCSYKKNAEVQEHEDTGSGRQEVLVDSLTGFSNRLGFLRQGKKILEFERGKTHRSLIYLHMNGLEAFREKSGYAAASSLTKTFAGIIAEQFQGSIIGTFSLDTFVILTVEENPERHIQKLQEEIADKKKHRVSFADFSAGIVSCKDEAEIEVLVDKARYVCLNPSSQGMTCRIFDNDALKNMRLESYLVNCFEMALAEKRIDLLYQPVVRLMTGKICGYEVYSRWKDPEYGELTPDQFLPVLENHGLACKLDLYVIRRVCEDLKRAAACNFPCLPVSVNLSISDFLNCDMAVEMEKICKDFRIRETFIRVEVRAESTSDHKLLIGEIKRLRQFGFEVWLDHFGKGAIPFAGFKLLDFDLIKLDMSNLINPKKDPKGAEAIYNAVLNAKDQGVRVLGEHIETIEQCEFLKEIGVGAAEGYYFSKPHRFSETVRLKANWEEEIEYLVTRPYYRELEKINLVDLRHNVLSLSSAFPAPASCIMERYDGVNHILAKGPTWDVWYENVTHWPEFSWDKAQRSEEWYSLPLKKEDKDVLMNVHFLTKDLRTGRQAFLVVFRLSET